MARGQEPRGSDERARLEEQLAEARAELERRPPADQVELLRSANEEAARQVDTVSREARAARAAAEEAAAERDAARRELILVRELRDREAADALAEQAR